MSRCPTCGHPVGNSAEPGQMVSAPYFLSANLAFKHIQQIPYDEARDLYKGDFDVFSLFDDGTEALIESDSDFKAAQYYGIEL